MKKHLITGVHASEISDSRGRPALKVTVEATHGSGSFAVPSGASTGSREAHELRDEDGSMTTALARIAHMIAPRLIGTSVSDQKNIDVLLHAIDGTHDFSVLGANSTIGVSIAAARAAAASHRTPLPQYLHSLAKIPPSRRTPRLFVNVINGGKHARGGSPFQEHQVITLSHDALQAFADVEAVESALDTLLTEYQYDVTTGDEGGFVFPVSNTLESFLVLAEAIERADVRDRVTIGADIAASSLYEHGKYMVCGTPHTTKELVARYNEIFTECALTHIEDPFQENDIESYAALHARNENIMVIGDDLTTTNAKSIRRAVDHGAINGVIIKPNQIGTLSDTLEAMKEARAHDVHCIISHRSGETQDTFIADLAVAFGAYGLKAGAPRARERRVKYERLITLTS